ncbi:conserved hypothetical protein [Candidatus Desulfosporosinus infrequens]|uniref:Uncharacterized protein n=1 Tax=Candidatus Desulfosporosinus infrequens TaxID=2043169 RepID=A0A2U3KRT4_9FIRM|nr:conserved hypothetical protein [Candidatus Desulfosporosinus infrequens]
MDKTKIFEWIGFVICISAMWVYGMIRDNGHYDTIWLYVSFSVMLIGGIITIIAFLIRKKAGQS